MAKDGYDRCPVCQQWALPVIGEADAVCCQKCGFIVQREEKEEEWRSKH